MYAKVFQQIYDSSIADDWEVRVVFIDLLILADRDGFIDMTQEAIAARTRMPLEMVNNAINLLTEPDKKSRTPDQDGRRLIPIDPRRGWGWKIVNYERYRNIRDENDRKSYMRNYMREYRKKELDAPVNSVNNVNKMLATPVSVSVVNCTKEGECEREENCYHPDARSALWYLNELAGKHFREVDSHLKIISARLKESEVTLDGVKQMISTQCARWKKDPAMNQYLRPATLFGKENFDNYYGNRGTRTMKTEEQSSLERLFKSL